METNLQNLFKEYLDECKYSRGLRPETIKGYKVTFDHFSAMMPGITTPELLSRETMNEFYKKIKTRKRMISKYIEKTGLED